MKTIVTRFLVVVICVGLLIPGYVRADTVRPLAGDKDDLKLDGYNPFIPQEGQYSRIRYSVQVDKYVTIRIYNLLGELITTLVDDEDTPEISGDYFVDWNGTNEDGDIVASGVYIVMAVIGDTVKTKKVVLINQKE